MKSNGSLRGGIADIVMDPLQLGRRRIAAQVGDARSIAAAAEIDAKQAIGNGDNEGGQSGRRPLL